MASFGDDEFGNMLAGILKENGVIATGISFDTGTANMSAKAGDCRGGYLSTIGGGCPDKQQCLETCRPCYQGYGTVYAFCVGPSGPLPYWECRCSFHKGAPCPPPGPPQCPGRWPRALTNSTTLNGTLV